MQTKWTIRHEDLESARRALVEAQEKVARIEEEIRSMSTTKFGGNCSGCGEFLATEEDFAKHYAVPDRRLYNLGNCPHRKTA